MENNKDNNSEAFEQFRNEILQWRIEHLLECKMFERSMYEDDGKGLLAVYKHVAMLLPSLSKTWKMLWLSNTEAELEQLDSMVNGSSIAKILVDDFRMKTEDICAGLILSWIFYGEFYECIVLLNEGFASHKKHLNWLERRLCSFVAKTAIKSSIKAGYRTKEQWERFNRTKNMVENGNALQWVLDELDNEIANEEYLYEEEIPEQQETTVIPPSDIQQMEPETAVQPLSYYLTMENKNEFINAFGNHIARNNDGWDYAIAFLVLMEERLMRIENIKTFRDSLALQYPNMNIKSARTIQTFVKKLKEKQRMTDKNTHKIIEVPLRDTPLYIGKFDDFRNAMTDFITS